MSDKIICFGDSNTYGYDIRSFLGGRFPKESRWTGILDKSSDFEVINYGENGREIPSSQEDLKRFDRILKLEAPFDLLIVMLGTNDLLNIFHPDMEKILYRMAAFLYHVLEQPDINQDPSKILLIAPPPTRLERIDASAAGFDRISKEFSAAYRKLASTLGIHFADAGKWNIELGADGVHFTETGHRSFAENLRKILTQ